MCEHVRLSCQKCEMSCANMRDVMCKHVRCHVGACQISMGHESTCEIIMSCECM